MALVRAFRGILPAMQVPYREDLKVDETELQSARSVNSLPEQHQKFLSLSEWDDHRQFLRGFRSSSGTGWRPAHGALCQLEQS